MNANQIRTPRQDARQDAKQQLPEHLKPAQSEHGAGVAGFEETELFSPEQPDEDNETNQEQSENFSAPVYQAETIEGIALRLNSQFDEARIKSGCSLLNAFNYAIQVQAKRNLWNAADYRAFIIALSAMDAIGKAAHEDEKTRQLEGDVRSALRK